MLDSASGLEEGPPSDCLSHRLIDDSLLLSLGLDTLLHLLEVRRASINSRRALLASRTGGAHAPEQCQHIDEHTLAPVVPRFWTRGPLHG